MAEERIACRQCATPALADVIRANAGLCMACHRAAWAQELHDHHAALEQLHGTLYLSHALMLPRNKNTAYRNRILALARGVVQALVELGLATPDVLARLDTDPDHFYLAPQDVREPAQLFFTHEFDRFLASTDRWNIEVPPVEKYRASFVKRYQAFAKR